MTPLSDTFTHSDQLIRARSDEQGYLNTLRRLCDESTLRLVGATGEEQVIPDSIRRGLGMMVEALHQGGVATVATYGPLIPPTRAAVLMGVSLQKLISELERGTFPLHELPGVTGSLLALGDVLAYREKESPAHRSWP